MGDLLSTVWGEILDRARSRMQPMPVDPASGLDNPPVPFSPMAPVAPWTFNLGSREATLSLPANKGANFEGYMRYGFDPFGPELKLKQLGLRYRYEF